MVVMVASLAFTILLAWPWSAQASAHDTRRDKGQSWTYGNHGGALPITPAQWEASQARVPALLDKVPAQHKKKCENVLRGRNRAGFSQAWQDWMLYRNYFAGQWSGMYVDIGANEALNLSNTAFFDICLRWQGICFEPQARYHAQIRMQRGCRLVPQCVMGRQTETNVQGAGTVQTFKPGTSDDGGSRDKTSAKLTAHHSANSTRREPHTFTRTCVGILDEVEKANIKDRLVRR